MSVLSLRQVEMSYRLLIEFFALLYKRRVKEFQATTVIQISNVHRHPRTPPTLGEGSYNARPTAATPIMAPMAAKPACFLSLIEPLLLVAEFAALDEVLVGVEDSML